MKSAFAGFAIAMLRPGEFVYPYECDASYGE